MVGVDDVGLHVLNQGPAGFEDLGDLPGVLGGDVEIYGDHGGACCLIFGGEAVGGRGESDHYFKAQGEQDADLVVDPSCSGGGFDDVQDLHEMRVVIVRSLMNAIKQYRKRGHRAECKGAGRPF